MNNIVKPTLVLGLIALVASMALSHIKKITYPNILKQEKEKQERALAMVLPGFAVGDKVAVKLDGGEFVYWPAHKDESGAVKKAYAFITSSTGYSGDVVSMVGVDEAGTILGLSILQQGETPGLGARSVEVASKNTFWQTITGNAKEEGEMSPWFQQQFTGLNGKNKITITKKGDWDPSIKDELLSRNAITAITGATITSRATIKGVEKGMDSLAKALEAASQAAPAGAQSITGGAR
ncbi:MAG TPA: FMN-binding protein [Spirochaetota bacterium]|nr:FMN-binding protein [Spirochaetota bacterium]